MAVKLSQFEKRLVALLSHGLPLCPRPYQALAQQLDCREEDVLEAIRGLLQKGVIRRFGATVRHDRSGYKGNVMVAWKVPEDRVENVGRFCAGLPFVTHCYVRKTAPDWPYNFYTMIHAADEAKCRELVEDLAQELGLEDYVLLFTEKEIVRKTRSYFQEELPEGKR